jgi:hypothetical protein
MSISKEDKDKGLRALAVLSARSGDTVGVPYCVFTKNEIDDVIAMLQPALGINPADAPSAPAPPPKQKQKNKKRPSSADDAASDSDAAHSTKKKKKPERGIDRDTIALLESKENKNIIVQGLLNGLTNPKIEESIALANKGKEYHKTWVKRYIDTYSAGITKDDPDWVRPAPKNVRARKLTENTVFTVDEALAICMFDRKDPAETKRILAEINFTMTDDDLEDVRETIQSYSTGGVDETDEDIVHRYVEAMAKIRNDKANARKREARARQLQLAEPAAAAAASGSSAPKSILEKVAIEQARHARNYKLNSLTGVDVDAQRLIAHQTPDGKGFKHYWRNYFRKDDDDDDGDAVVEAQVHVYEAAGIEAAYRMDLVNVVFNMWLKLHPGYKGMGSAFQGMENVGHNEPFVLSGGVRYSLDAAIPRAPAASSAAAAAAAASSSSKGFIKRLQGLLDNQVGYDNEDPFTELDDCIIEHLAGGIGGESNKYIATLLNRSENDVKHRVELIVDFNGQENGEFEKGADALIRGIIDEKKGVQTIGIWNAIIAKLGQYVHEQHRPETQVALLAGNRILAIAQHHNLIKLKHSPAVHQAAQRAITLYSEDLWMDKKTLEDVLARFATSDLKKMEAIEARYNVRKHVVTQLRPGNAVDGRINRALDAGRPLRPGDMQRALVINAHRAAIELIKCLAAEKYAKQAYDKNRADDVLKKRYNDAHTRQVRAHQAMDAADAAAQPRPEEEEEEKKEEEEEEEDEPAHSPMDTTGARARFAYKSYPF